MTLAEILSDETENAAAVLCVLRWLHTTAEGQSGETQTGRMNDERSNN